MALTPYLKDLNGPQKKVVGILLFLINATWAFMAYLSYRAGVPPRVIAIVVAIGVVIGNVAAYAGIRIAVRLLRESEPNLEVYCSVGSNPSRPSSVANSASVICA